MVPTSSARILYYAVNGAGLGHLVRLTTIATELALQRRDLHQLMVTTATNTDVIQRAGIPYVRLPLHDSAVVSAPNRGLAVLPRPMLESILRNVIEEYAPTVVVFDVMYPRSVLRAIAPSTKTALVLRAAKPWFLEQITANGDHEVLDAILVAEHEADFWRGIPGAVRKDLETRDLTFLGPVGRPAHASSDRFLEVAKRCGLNELDKFILISCGGGGILNSASEFISRSVAAATAVGGSFGMKVVLVTGPNFKPLPIIENVAVISFEPELPLLMAHASAVVTHAGPNSLRELQASGTPGLIVPMDRPNEDQTARASHLDMFEVVSVLAPVDDYVEKLRETLKRPRTPSFTFPGAARAASRLASLLDPALMLVLSRMQHVTGVRAADVEDLEALLGRHRRVTSLLLDDEFVGSIAASDNILTRLGRAMLVVNLRDNHNLETMSSCAARILTELSNSDVPPSRITLTYEESASCRLSEVAQALSAFRFSSLITRTNRTAPSEIFDLFFSCYFVAPDFKIDVTPAKAPVFDAVFWN